MIEIFCSSVAVTAMSALLQSAATGPVRPSNRQRAYVAVAADGNGNTGSNNGNGNGNTGNNSGNGNGNGNTGNNNGNGNTGNNRGNGNRGNNNGNGNPGAGEAHITQYISLFIDRHHVSNRQSTAPGNRA